MKKYIHICILCLLIVSCDFLVRPNLLQVQVNGVEFNKIPVKKGEAFIGSYWEGGNVHYRLKIGILLRGKRFSIHPLSLGLLPSAPNITVLPDSNNCILNSKNYEISNTIFNKTILANQCFDITYNALIDNDTVSFKVPPSNLLLFDGEPILNDTITIAFPKLNHLNTEQEK